MWSPRSSAVWTTKSHGACSGEWLASSANPGPSAKAFTTSLSTIAIRGGAASPSTAAGKARRKPSWTSAMSFTSRASDEISTNRAPGPETEPSFPDATSPVTYPAASASDPNCRKYAAFATARG